MKNNLAIIEDNFCKFFAAKQLLESHFKLTVCVLSADSDVSLSQHLRTIKPNTVLCNEANGIFALCDEIKKRKLNRRNCKIYLIIKNNIDRDPLEGTNILGSQTQQPYLKSA